ncbi:uncharacterized protein ACBR49_017541 [Aulostomus maculatus]
MTELTWIFWFLCFTGSHLSEASPVLRSAKVVPAGGNVSLTCNLTCSEDISWYLVRSDHMSQLLMISFSKLRDPVVAYGAADRRRINYVASEENRLVLVELSEVQETDAGLYLCLGTCAGIPHVDGVTDVVIEGVDGGSARDGSPCLSVGVCVLPSVLLACAFLSFTGFYLCSGKPAVCCCDTTNGDAPLKVAEDITLHYSSLRHAKKPRPSGQRGTGSVDSDVTYSTVSSRSHQPNGY